MAQHQKDDLKAKATRGIGWVIVERWGNRLLTLLVFTVLARVVAPEAFGIISLATVVVAILQVFVDSGFSKALVQRKALGPKDASTAFWVSLAISGVLSIAIVAVSPAIAAAFGEPDLTRVLQALALGLPLIALSRVPAALLEREFGFKALSIRQLVGAFAGAVTAVPLALAGAGPWALVAQTLVTSVVSVGVLWASTPWRPRFEFSIDSLRALAPIGVSMLGIELLDAVQNNIDKFLIGAFFTTEQLGYYFIAQRIGMILSDLVTTVMARVSLTTFSRVQDDPVRLNRVLRQLTFSAAAVGIPIFGLVAVLAPQTIPFLFGDGWDESVPILWVLAPAWALGAVMYFDRNVLLATGHGRTALAIALLQNVVSIVLIFVFLPFGILGVAFSRWGRIWTWPVRLYLLRRLVGVSVSRYLTQLARCLIAVAPSLILIGLLQGTSWASGDSAFWTFAVPVGMLGLALYAALLWIVAGGENRRALTYISLTVLSRFRRRPTHTHQGAVS